MKKAEAISILATSVRPREAKDRARYDEAVKMAIEALKCSETPKSSEQNAETAQANHIAESGKKVSISCAHENDVISRQAAIDALGEKPFAGTGDEYDYEQGLQNQWERDVVAIKILPSAQPEIVLCKECKHFEYDKPYIIQGVTVLANEVCNAWGRDGCKTNENGYCFLAERRTDD